MSEEIKRESICWVPICPNQYFPDKNYYHLPPINTIRREIWLAMATKSTKDVNVEDNILFCEDHFEVSSGQVISINNTTYKLDEVTIPSKNMPDQVCRMCNLLINSCSLVNNHKEQFFTMSSVLTSQIPASIQEELSYHVEESEVPLRHVLQFCFKEFDIPTDIIPILCSNCFHNLWLFYMFKKRAMAVETCLEEDSTPENYGNLALCRTCPEQCYNFYQHERDSEMGVLLQGMFANDYSTDMVPLRVCLNCNNVLKKICDFHKKCINAKKIMEKRAILNEKFKLKTTANVGSSTQKNQLPKEEVIGKNKELTPLELFNLMKEYKNIKGENADLLTFQDLTPEFIMMLRVKGWDQNIDMLKEVFNKMRRSKLINSVSTSVTKKNPSISGNKKSNGTAQNSPRAVGRPPAATFAKKMWLAKVMRREFNKSTAEDKRNRGFWQILLRRITQKYPTKEFPKLLSLWTRIKMSAKTHKVDGSCPIDAIVMKMLEKFQNETEKNRKSSNKTSPAKKKSDEDVPNETPHPKKIKMNGNEQSNTAGPSSSSTNVCEEIDGVKQELFKIIKSSYMEIKKDIDVGDDLWSKVLQRAYANGYNTLPIEEANVVWGNLRKLCESALGKDSKQPVILEINQFLKRVRDNGNKPETSAPLKRRPSQLKKQQDEKENGTPGKRKNTNKIFNEQKNILNKQAKDKSDSTGSGEEQKFQKIQIINTPIKEEVETNNYDHVSFEEIKWSLNNSSPIKVEDVDSSVKTPTKMEVVDEDSNETINAEDYVGARDLDLD